MFLLTEKLRSVEFFYFISSISRISKTFVLLALLLAITSSIQAQVHLAPDGMNVFNLTWNSSPTNPDEVNWSSAGALTSTFTNVDNSGVNISMTFSGDTSTLAAWNFGGGSDTPVVGTDASEGAFEVLQYFTTGFDSTGITLTITFSEPVSEVGFDLFHINGAGPNGDSYLITALDTFGSTVYPAFTSTATPSYTSNSSGFINSTNNSTAGDNDWAGVNFSSTHMINTITLVWDECSACTAGTVHGSALGNFSFTKVNLAPDSDADGVVDRKDVDDDNDGIMDAFEACPNDTIPTVDTITVEIQLDDYGSETTWTLTNSAGSTVASGGPYTNFNRTLISEDYIGAFDTYSLNIFDSFNDGICCAYGSGYYLLRVNGDVVVGTTNNGNFGGSSTISHSLEPNYISCLGDDPHEDADNDGVVNYQDADYCTLNSAGVCTSLDADGDGIINQMDLDADNDGIPDIVEASGIETEGDGRVDFPVSGNPNSMIDRDGDGLSDTYDPFDNGFGSTSWSAGTLIPNNDLDGDNLSDALDLDADNDGIPDLVEVGGVDAAGLGIVDVGALPWDADGDGLADIYDTNASDGPGGSGVNGTALVTTTADLNNNGIVDAVGEAMQGNAGTRINMDGDSQPNHLDLDADNDGITDIS